MSSSGAKTGSGTVSDITTSGQPLITITDPSGPTTNLAVGAYAPGTSVESYITANVGLVAATGTEITSVALSAGTWLVTGRACLNVLGALVTAGELWIGPDSALATGVYAGSYGGAGVVAGGDEDLYISVTKVVTLAADTTVYLNADAQGAMTVLAADTFLSLAAVTGITAVRIA